MYGPKMGWRQVGTLGVQQNAIWCTQRGFEAMKSHFGLSRGLLGVSRSGLDAGGNRLRRWRRWLRLRLFGERHSRGRFQGSNSSETSSFWRLARALACLTVVHTRDLWMSNGHRAFDLSIY